MSRLTIKYINSYYYLNYSSIKEFKNKTDWTKFSQRPNLPEDFIRKYKNKVYWDEISQYQKLSESFIREFKDKLS